MRFITAFIGILWAGGAAASPLDAVFPSIDGGEIALRDYAGQPMLVVNTASQCGFTPQYDALQSLHERYGAQGLVVLAVPSDDFNQELETTAEIKEFCEVNFGLTLPMTDMLSVKGEGAHSFYRDVRAATGFEPQWNFNKVLIGAEGEILGTWGSGPRPDRGPILRAIKAALD